MNSVVRVVWQGGTGVRIAPDVYLIGSGRVGFMLSDTFDCNVYALRTAEGVALFDCGAGMGMAQMVGHLLDDGLDPADVRWLLLTHGHGDHAGGGAAARQAFPGLRIAASARVAAWMRDADEGSIGLRAARAAGIYPANYCLRAFEVDRVMGEGERLTLGAHALEVLETPGHSDGHLCFMTHCDGGTYLFSGDQVFHGGKILIQNIPDCRLANYAASMAKLAGRGVTHLFPGHMAFVLRDGQAHIDRANAIFASMGIPPNITD